MSDMTETLQDLLERRLREMGKRRGRGENLSLREAWMRLPEEDGKRAVSYETVRRIREIGHTKINDQTADALATMLDVDIDVVLEAAGQRRRLGRFELPRRADRLTEPERAAILGVVDAILSAGGEASGDRATPLRAVASSGDASDADQVEEIARRAREQQTRDT